MKSNLRILRLLAVFVLLPSLVACAALAQDEDAAEAVAKVGNVTLTKADLEAHLSDQLAQLELQKSKLMEQGLGPLVEKTLLDQAAAKAGKSPADYLQEAVAGHTEPVTDASVETWYVQNKSRLGGQSKEALADRIKQFLEQSNQAQARAAVLADLRKEFDVEIFLEPARVKLSEAGATVKGSDDAPVTIVEFSDFECPACKGFNPILGQVMERYGDDVRVVFRQFPLRSIHPKAQKAAEASLCARDQGKFWELHDAMFDDQRNLDVTNLKTKAAELGINSEGFDQCLDSGQYAAVVQSDLDLGGKIGVSGTPAVFINGREVAPGRVPSFGMMAALIDEELLRAGSKSD